MKILVRHRQGEKWEQVDHTKYVGEAHLRDILYDDAEVIPIEDIKSETELAPKILMLKEVGLPGSDSARATDLVGIDKKGNVCIIETKLASNSQAKREVIGQILEYAAFLYERGMDWLDDIAKRQRGVSIAEYFEEDKDWDKESFEQNLRDSLNEGKFKLFIAIDEMNDELQTIISYMKNILGVEIYALEFRYFKEKAGMEILVPNVHGGKKHAISSPPPAWTEEKFFNDAEKKVDADTLQTLKKLYGFSKQVGPVDFGSGRTTGTFRVSLTYKGEPVRFYVISPSRSWNWFAFKSMSQRGIDKTLIALYVQQLKSIGFPFDEKKHLESDAGFDVAILNDEEKLSAFEKYTIELKEKLATS